MTQRWEFRVDIQGLRALAIALVILAHFDIPPFTGGFVGVDVFFVISGYLITGLLWRELVQNGWICLAAFYARRLRRLMPALVTVVGVTLAAALLLLSGLEIDEQTNSAPFALTWTSNLYFAFRSEDYFAWLQQRDLYLHTWSLGVEEQFYLFWPLLLWAVFAAIHTDKARRFAFLAIALLSLLACIYVTGDQTTLAFYLPVFRIWEFCLGALVFLFPAPRGWMRGILLFVGVAAILAAAVFFDRGMPYPGAWALIPAIGSALVIAANVQSSWSLGNPLLVRLGDVSYSLYLWHWPVLVLGAAWGFDRSLTGKGDLLALCLMLSIATYLWVERPFWKGRFSRLGVPRQVFVAAAVTMVVGSVTTTVATGVTRDVKIPQEAALLAFHGDLPAIYRAGCDHWYQDDEVVPCVMGRGEAKKTVALIGDSIGAQWVSLLPEVFPDARIVVVTKSSCPMVDAPYFYERIGQVYRVCERWRDKALDYLKSLHPDVVFVGSASTYPYSDREWIEGSRQIFGRLAEAAGQVFVIAGTPQLGMDGPGCLARVRNRLHLAERFCAREMVSNPVTRVNQLLVQAAAPVPGVRVVDFGDRVCPENRCSALQQGVVVFRDNQHLTDSFVRHLAPQLREEIASLVTVF